MRVLIIGGGIGGLALGASLRRHGIAYDIVERTREYQWIGAGIGVGANALAVLRALGLAHVVEARGNSVSTRIFADAQGRPLRRVALDNVEDSHSIHRALLLEALLAAAGRDSVRLGTTVVSLAPGDDGVDVATSDGARARYDAVVGCDGIRSKAREHVDPEARLRYRGACAIRFVVPRPDTVSRHELLQMMHGGRQMGLVPIGDGKLYVYCGYGVPEAQATQPADILSTLRREYAGFGGPVPGILGSLGADDTLIFNRIDELTNCRWVRGRVALLGDAAHAMAPAMGQGGAMALEDAFVLARQLAAAGGSTGEALARYALARRPRVAAVQRLSQRINDVGIWTSPLACRLRELALRHAPLRLEPPQPLADLAG